MRCWLQKYYLQVVSSDVKLASMPITLIVPVLKSKMAWVAAGLAFDSCLQIMLMQHCFSVNGVVTPACVPKSLMCCGCSS